MARTNLAAKPNRIYKATSSLKVLSNLFRGECRTAKSFANALQVSAPTAAARLGSPQEMTLEELITATVNLGVTGNLSVCKDGTNVEIHW